MGKTNIKIVFGNSVKFWREQLGLTQTELAARTGLQRTYISDVERGGRNLSLESIERFAAALQVTIPALFKAVEPADGGRK